MRASNLSRTQRGLVPLLACVFAIAWSLPADAQRGGRGGGAPAARASAHSSVNRPAGGGAQRSGQAQQRAASGSRDVDRDTTRTVNRSSSVNVNQNVNIDADDFDNDHWNDWDDHPVATAAAVTGAVALTSAAIGSIVNDVPPSCATSVVGDVSYLQCGNTWYMPQYAGNNVQYVVVSPP